MKRKTLAIPIRCVDFSDSSQVVAFFTSDCGLVEGIAKGAHRAKNPFQGPFDLAVLYELVFLERSSGLCLLTEAAVMDGFRGLRRSWSHYLGACHILEFLRLVAMPGDPDPDLFGLAWWALSSLEARGAPADAVASRFDVRALRLLGLLAPLDACVGCGREWPGDRAVLVSARAGGILCARCRSEAPPAGGVSLPAPAARILRALAEDEGDSAAEPPGWEDFGKPVSRVIDGLRTNLLERELVLLKSRAGSNR